MQVRPPKDTGTPNTLFQEAFFIFPTHAYSDILVSVEIPPACKAHLQIIHLQILNMSHFFLTLQNKSWQ